MFIKNYNVVLIHDKIKPMKSCLKLTTILLFSLLLISPVHAQTPTSIDGVEITTNPDEPAPLQDVTVSIESFNTDLNAASIIWLVAGKTYAKGTGITSIHVTAPPLGKELAVSTIIMTVEGKEVKKALSIKSGGVDLVWESAGYIPPFYEGKALYTYENQIKVSAMPHLSGPKGELDPRTLIYKWTENDKVVQDQSGYGKQTLNIQEETPRPLEIKVDVGTPNGSQKGTATITITPGDPSITFYEDDPLYGIFFNKAIPESLNLINPEVTIHAVPYGFTTSTRVPLSYSWSINNLERNDLSTNQSITLRTKEDTEGSSDISLRIRGIATILQGAQNAVSVMFSKKTEN